MSTTTNTPAPSTEITTTPTTASTKSHKDGRDSPANSSSGGSSHLLVEHPDQDEKKVMMSATHTSTKTATISSRAMAVLDRFLRGYTHFMSSGVHQDRGIKLLQYTLWMLSYAVSKTPSGKSPGMVVVRDALKKLFNELSFARYVLRFLGLPPALEAVRSGSWDAGSRSHPGWHKWLGRLLAWSMVGYYPLEYGAYLQWQTPRLFFARQPPSSRLAEKLSAWSCRFWLVYTVTELVQCGLKLREETHNLQLLEEQKKNDTVTTNTNESADALTVAAPAPGTIRNLRLQIVRDLLFTLPAIHWSLPNWDIDPLLTDPQCNILMWLESVVCMYQSILNFNNK